MPINYYNNFTFDGTAVPIFDVVAVNDPTYTVVGYAGSYSCNCINNNIIINLPTAIGYGGLSNIFSKVDSSVNTITLIPCGTETINGNSSLIIQHKDSSVTLQSDGANLRII